MRKHAYRVVVVALMDLTWINPWLGLELDLVWNVQ
jgi:hypothetical protein